MFLVCIHPVEKVIIQKTAFPGPGLLVLTDTCNNCDRQKRYDKYDTKEHCCKSKLAAHLSQNHILSANKYSFLQLMNLKLVWFGFCLVWFFFCVIL